MCIEDGIEKETLKNIITQLNAIDLAFERGEADVLLKQAEAEVEEKAKAWCAKHGLEYDPTDDATATEQINAAVKRVRAA
jgi:DNA-binding FrmR family transcriptional regulator